ncbi:MAG: molybdopterin-dependent oxidoreductase [Sphingomonadales bacterium]|nr:molybdopterin-dependent oxidoreductase [Sphingomonadales bacterium]
MVQDSSEAWVGIEVDGTVIVRCAVTDIGAGQSSSLAKIVAEVLGVPMEKLLPILAIARSILWRGHRRQAAPFT